MVSENQKSMSVSSGSSLAGDADQVWESTAQCRSPYFSFQDILLADEEELDFYAILNVPRDVFPFVPMCCLFNGLFQGYRRRNHESVSTQMSYFPPRPSHK